jgi:hypothetical protein
MELDRPYFLALFAEVLAADRQFDRALAAIDEAQQQASLSRSFFYQAELWRLRGSVLLAAQGGRRQQEADDCLANAVAVATRQNARVLLLRAELARARLRDERARTPDGANTLLTVYDSFTEGLDSPDLIEAAHFVGRPVSAADSAGS